MLLHTALFCLTIVAILPGTFAANCNNIIRLADLQSLIKDQAKLIEKQAKVNDDLWQRMEYLRTGVYFTVGLTTSQTFSPQIKFDKIITNIGGGYIDDVNSADYGKFIAPLNGTYQFNANFYNENKLIGGDLMKNGLLVVIARNGGSGPASLSAIVDLKEGDEVYLKSPTWVSANTGYDRYFTTFSGVRVSR